MRGHLRGKPLERSQLLMIRHKLLDEKYGVLFLLFC